MEKLAEKIEIMTKDDQIEVLRFFVRRNLKVNENKIDWLPQPALYHMSLPLCLALHDPFVRHETIECLC